MHKYFWEVIIIVEKFILTIVKKQVMVKPLVLYPPLRGIALTAFGCRMNSTNRYYCAVLVEYP